jgi:hypothetical protein
MSSESLNHSEDRPCEFLSPVERVRIGKPLIDQLRDAGHDATVLTRDPAAARKLNTRGIAAATGDALDPASVAKAVAQSRPDVIVNELTNIPRKMNPSGPPANSPRPMRCARAARQTYWRPPSRRPHHHREVWVSRRLLARQDRMKPGACRRQRTARRRECVSI